MSAFEPGATGPNSGVGNGASGSPSESNAAASQINQRTKKPTALSPEFAKIPAELKSLPNWVLWRYSRPKSPKQKWRKVPFQPNARAANVADKSTWSMFEACCAAYARVGFDGTGFVFDGEVGPDGLCYYGVDFDACLEDGKPLEPACSRIAQLNTYTEVSVSGTGIHCIVRATPGHTAKYTSPEKGSPSKYTAMPLISRAQVARSVKFAVRLEPRPRKSARSSRTR
jgi:hypothetical protein